MLTVCAGVGYLLGHRHATSSHTTVKGQSHMTSHFIISISERREGLQRLILIVKLINLRNVESLVKQHTSRRGVFL